MRLALALLLALFVGQALVYPSAPALEVCAQTCPDDRPDGSCDPLCVDCSCCHHGARQPGALASTPAPDPLPSRELVEAAAPVARRCDPADVFHVPRSLA